MANRSRLEFPRRRNRRVSASGIPASKSQDVEPWNRRVPASGTAVSDSQAVEPRNRRGRLLELLLSLHMTASLTSAELVRAGTYRQSIWTQATNTTLTNPLSDAMGSTPPHLAGAGRPRPNPERVSPPRGQPDSPLVQALRQVFHFAAAK